MERIKFNPLVTLALFHYNQEELVAGAMKAALDQDYSPLEIIVSDDCSTDGTWDAIRNIAKDYTGPHQLRISRNEKNLGIGPHVGKVGMMAKGKLMVQADGDDISYSNRVSSIVEEWARHDFCSGAIHSSVLVKSSDNDSGKILESIASDLNKSTLGYFAKNHFRALMNGASIAYTKDVFSEFPPLRADFEDIPLTLRALLLGKLMYVDQPLLEYYTGEGNVSRPLQRKDPKRVVDWFETIERNVNFMEQDYLHYMSNNSGSADDAILEEFSNVRDRCRRAIGLASPNLMALIKGMIAYPYDIPVKQRIAFHLNFFDII